MEDFKSSEKYRQMVAEYKKLLRFHHREMKQMENELAKAHRETVTVRRYWSEVMDDLDKEHQVIVCSTNGRNRTSKKQNLELARQRDAAKDKLNERAQQYYAIATEQEEERGKNKSQRSR